MKYDQTVFDLAAEYVDCLHKPPNGLGQHIHKRFGASHYVLRHMNRVFGQDATTSAITLEFKHRRETDDASREIPIEKRNED